MKFAPGQEVGVRAHISPGPFPDEFLVRIDTPSGAISGFVKGADIAKIGKDTGFVRATIREVEADRLSLLISGSFFTTAGIVTVPARCAEELLAPAA